jgi:multidrug efflux pump subunit AcrA (membrane-fusion protein)
MRAKTGVVALVFVLCPQVARPQSIEPEVLKATVSVHEVLRGNMLLRQNFLGSVTSLNPPTVTLTDPRTGVLRVGQKASFQIKPPVVLTGRVVRTGSATADIELADSLPDGTSVGFQLGAMVEVGELANVVFFDRPADAQPNTETIIFLIEPDGQHAKRVPVHYGRISGPQIEIVSGLSPGDRVIVTDMSKWASYARVTLK